MEVSVEYIYSSTVNVIFFYFEMLYALQFWINKQLIILLFGDTDAQLPDHVFIMWATKVEGRGEKLKLWSFGNDAEKSFVWKLQPPMKGNKFHHQVKEMTSHQTNPFNWFKGLSAPLGNY